jgi:hypothetical protein
MSTPEKTVATLLERLSASRPQRQAVETKTLGTVYLRRLTGADQLRIHAMEEVIGATKLASLPRSTWAAVVGAVMLLKEDGTQLFDDADAGYKVLVQAGSRELEELCDALLSVQVGSKALENAEKKSSSDQTSEPGTN